MQRKVWFSLFGQFFFMAVALFASAGTLRWPAAWALLAIFSSITTAMSLRLAKTDPELLAERMRVRPQQDQPSWDRAVMRILLALMIAWLVSAGLDAVRFHWTFVPAWLQVVAGVVTAAALWGVYRLMYFNSYLAPTVRVQRERGHTVVSTGPYGVVRHPFYAVLVPFFLSGSLLLGSWLSFLVSASIGVLLAFRCVREERYLSQELEGYADYMQQVRSRLIPHVW